MHATCRTFLHVAEWLLSLAACTPGHPACGATPAVAIGSRPVWLPTPSPCRAVGGAASSGSGADIRQCVRADAAASRSLGVLAGVKQRHAVHSDGCAGPARDGHVHDHLHAISKRGEHVKTPRTADWLPGLQPGPVRGRVGNPENAAACVAWADARPRRCQDPTQLMPQPCRGEGRSTPKARHSGRGGVCCCWMQAWQVAGEFTVTNPDPVNSMTVGNFNVNLFAGDLSTRLVPQR